jgi:hypothetical protein
MPPPNKRKKRSSEASDVSAAILKEDSEIGTYTGEYLRVYFDAETMGGTGTAAGKNHPHIPNVGENMPELLDCKVEKSGHHRGHTPCYGLLHIARTFSR